MLSRRTAWPAIDAVAVGLLESSSNSLLGTEVKRIVERAGCRIQELLAERPCDHRDILHPASPDHPSEARGLGPVQT